MSTTRREIWIDNNQFDMFVMFLEDCYGPDKAMSYSKNHTKTWVSFHADEEFMVLLNLKFKVKQLKPFGTSIKFG